VLSSPAGTNLTNNAEAGQQETVVIFMKAKEIAHKHMPNEFKLEVKNKGSFDPDFIIGEWIINSMKDYAAMKCKEQRDICMEEYHKSINEGGFPHGAITGAPEPVMD